MNKKTLLLVYFLTVTLSAYSQQGKEYVDSLQNALNLHTQKDSIRVNLLITFANTITHANPGDARKYAEESLQISEGLKFQRGIARSYRQLGYILYTQSDYPAAQDYYLKALKASEPLHDKKFEGSMFNNLALLYTELSEFERALSDYQKFLDITRELSLHEQEAIALMNMGLVYMKTHDYSNSILHFEQSLAIAYTYRYTQVIAYAQNNLGAVLDQKGEHQKAILCFEKSILYADSINDTRIKAEALGGMSGAYLELKEYDKAEKYSLQSLQFSKALNLLQFQSEMYQVLSEVYTKQQKPAKALETYKIYISIRDSILNDEKKSEMSRKEMQFEFEKKEALLKAEHDKKEALAGAEISRQQVIKNSVAGGAGVLLIASVFSFGFYKRRRDADEQKKESDFKAQVSETEMKALRLQMNPHFIFNSLNSISDYILKHDTKTADHYLTKFAKVMRLILENSEQKEITLADDLNALELYMQLESLRLNNKFSYEIKIDDSVDKNNTLVPPLLLQPFVENSIWHGISKKEGQGKILIHINKKGDMINCSVEDNGIGREKSEAIHAAENYKNTKSLGMKITRARIDIINKIKKSKAAIEISDLAEGFRVDIRLPLELSF